MGCLKSELDNENKLYERKLSFASQYTDGAHFHNGKALENIFLEWTNRLYEEFYVKGQVGNLWKLK